MQTKDAIRKRVWSLMEEEHVSRFPGARGRIPNFMGAEVCARFLAQWPTWQRARVLKVNPDSPQRAVRQRALEEGKTLYMAVPRLSDIKPFIELDPKALKVSHFAASSIKGASLCGRRVLLEEVKKIDLIVCGSVAVNRQGARVGKGGGYSDLEYALLREEEKVGATTPIVTTVHGFQVLTEPIPMTEHDIPLNALVTPEGWVPLRPRRGKPKGIYWEQLDEEKIQAIPVLQWKRNMRGARLQ
ncbi:MAG TPA: 5-formyltetrahydrofolate cyclo-ligase [Candidatus Binatia bacterium]